MSTTASFLRIGSHVVNLSKINHIWFDDLEESAFVDFGERGNDEGWDLILTGADARALRSHFDHQGEGR